MSVAVVAVDRLASNRITAVSRRKGRCRSMLILNDVLPAKLGVYKLKVRVLRNKSSVSWLYTRGTFN